MTMFELSLVTEIDAPAGRVWEILTDAPAYPRWNPFLRCLDGPLEAGAQLEVHVAFPGNRTRRLHASVREFQPGCALRWQASLWKRHIFDVSYAFEIEALDPGGTLLTQRVAFGGVLVPFLVTRIARSIHHGLMEMNLALKAEVEEVLTPTEWHAAA
jgi:hypothetical protein